MISCDSGNAGPRARCKACGLHPDPCEPGISAWASGCRTWRCPPLAQHTSQADPGTDASQCWPAGIVPLQLNSEALIQHLLPLWGTVLLSIGWLNRGSRAALLVNYQLGPHHSSHPHGDQWCAGRRSDFTSPQRPSPGPRWLELAAHPAAAGAFSAEQRQSDARDSNPPDRCQSRWIDHLGKFESARHVDCPAGLLGSGCSRPSPWFAVNKRATTETARRSGRMRRQCDQRKRR